MIGVGRSDCPASFGDLLCCAAKSGPAGLSAAAYSKPDVIATGHGHCEVHWGSLILA